MIVSYVNPWRTGGWATRYGQFIPPVPPMAGFGGLGSLLAIPAFAAIMEKYFPTDEDTVREQVVAELGEACTQINAGPPPSTDKANILLAGLAGAAVGASIVYFSRKRLGSGS